MADKGKWQQVRAFNQQARDNVVRKYADMRQTLTGAFADPEFYGKITAISDQGISGINLAVRKHRDAEDDFNKVFIDRAKQYSECKDEIKKNGAMLKDEFQKAEGRAKSYGLKCHNR